ncbi:MAG: hypothetical protein HC777_02945 [Hyphomonadaceae bacterium]|nr:hypothetical protein [Hyphomonadaceae bacterium]
MSTRIISGGIFQMPVPTAPAAGYRLVLGGFKITNGGSVGPFESGDTQIELISINAQDAFPLPSTNSQSSISGSIRTNSPTRPINIAVQYVWIPSSFITMSASAQNDTPSMGRPSGAVRALAVARGQVPETDKYVIRGFEFEYLNGPHNVLSVGVHLNGATLSGRRDEAVSFQDNNVDDPIRWNVSFFRVN